MADSRQALPELQSTSTEAVLALVIQAATVADTDTAQRSPRCIDQPTFIGVVDTEEEFMDDLTAASTSIILRHDRTAMDMGMVIAAITHAGSPSTTIQFLAL